MKSVAKCVRVWEKLGGGGEVQRSVLGCKDVHFKIFSYFRIISNRFLNSRIFPEYRILLQNNHKFLYFSSHSLVLQNRNWTT